MKSENNPTLQKAKLGWIISGSIMVPNQVQRSNQTFLAVDALHKDVEKFWKVDEFIQNKPNYLVEEKYCLEFFDKTTTRDSSGRFIVKYPLNSSEEELGDSYEEAKSRFFSLERKFDTKNDFKTAYVDCIQDYLDQGHATESVENEPNSFILPHHAVIKATSQTTKLRVVFDGTCHIYDGKSINQF